MFCRLHYLNNNKCEFNDRLSVLVHLTQNSSRTFDWTAFWRCEEKGLSQSEGTMRESEYTLLFFEIKNNLF